MTLQYNLLQYVYRKWKKEGKGEEAAFPVFYPLVLCHVWGNLNISKITSIFPSQKTLELEKSQMWHVKCLRKRRGKNGSALSETCTILVPTNESRRHSQVRLGEKGGRDGVGETSSLSTSSATVRYPIGKAKGSQSDGIICLDKGNVWIWLWISQYYRDFVAFVHTVGLGAWRV